MKRFQKLPLALAIVAASSSTSYSTASYAQAESGGLEEVVVTARYRQESVQDVPVAVTALSGNFMEDNNIMSMLDIEKYVPNVEFTIMAFAGGALSASIRGLSFDDLEKSFEPAVGVSIDGMFMGTNAGANVDFFDVASVEVLRGPQGTLFGRNTIAGAVNIKRTRPTGEFGAKLMADIGRYDHVDLKAVVNLPIIPDVLAAKITGRSLDNNTFQYNVTRGEDVDGRDLTQFGGSLLFTPTDNFEALFTFDFYDDQSHPPELLNQSTDDPRETDLFCVLVNPVACGSASADLSAQKDYTESYSPIPFLSSIEGHNLIGEINWDIGNFNLTSITAVQDFDELLDIENSGAPILLFTPYRPGTYEQFSQELRAQSQFDGPFNFVAGLFYFNSEYTMDGNADLLGGRVTGFYHYQEVDAYSVFGEGTYDITSKLRLTVGARWTEEDKLADHDNWFGGFTFKGEDTWSEVTPRVGFDYSFNNDVMAYVMWSTGFRSGGFTGRPGNYSAASTPFDPETVENLEFGVRSEWFDNRLRLNFTVFSMKLEDKQEAVVVPEGNSTNTYVLNAAQADFSGWEFEGALAPFEDHDLNFRAAIGYLDASYDELPYLENGSLVDISNDALVVYAPEVTASAGIDYTRQLAGGELKFNMNWKYTDDSYGRTADFRPDALNRHIIESYDTLDLSLGYTFPVGDTMVSITAYGQDVLEEGGRLARPYDTGGLWWFNTPVMRRNYGVQFGIEF